MAPVETTTTQARAFRPCQSATGLHGEQRNTQRLSPAPIVPGQSPETRNRRLQQLTTAVFRPDEQAGIKP